MGPQRGDDLAHERQRRLGHVPSLAILRVPAGGDGASAHTSPFSRMVFSSQSQIR